MGRPRSKRTEENVLSKEELKGLQTWLSQQSVPTVEGFYRSAYHRCALQPKWLPSPRAIQELVQAWKRLRKARS